MKYTHYMQVTSLTGYRFVIQGSYTDLDGDFIQMAATGETLHKGWK